MPQLKSACGTSCKTVILQKSCKSGGYRARSSQNVYNIVRRCIILRDCCKNIARRCKITVWFWLRKSSKRTVLKIVLLQIVHDRSDAQTINKSYKHFTSNLAMTLRMICGFYWFIFATRLSISAKNRNSSIFWRWNIHWRGSLVMLRNTPCFRTLHTL